MSLYNSCILDLADDITSLTCPSNIAVLMPPYVDLCGDIDAILL
jgi:hypothetical protein